MCILISRVYSQPALSLHLNIYSMPHQKQHLLLMGLFNLESLDLWYHCTMHFFHCILCVQNILKPRQNKTKQEGPNFDANNGILLPKLFGPTVRKKCSRDWEKLLKFEAEGREFSNFLRSLEQFVRTVKVQNRFW